MQKKKTRKKHRRAALHVTLSPNWILMHSGSAIRMRASVVIHTYTNTNEILLQKSVIAADIYYSVACNGMLIDLGLPHINRLCK